MDKTDVNCKIRWTEVARATCHAHKGSRQRAESYLVFLWNITLSLAWYSIIAIKLGSMAEFFISFKSWEDAVFSVLS